MSKLNPPITKVSATAEAAILDVNNPAGVRVGSTAGRLDIRATAPTEAAAIDLLVRYTDEINQAALKLRTEHNKRRAEELTLPCPKGGYCSGNPSECSCR